MTKNTFSVAAKIILEQNLPSGNISTGT